MKKLVLIRVGILIALFFSIYSANAQTEDNSEEEEQSGSPCGGTERWAEKVLTDALATTVNYTPTSSTVVNLVNLTTPFPNPNMNRQAGLEDITYQINCHITIKKSETDDDYHLVLSDGTHTLIGEIPNPVCSTAVTSPHHAQYLAARNFIDANIATGNVYNVNIGMVTVTGVAFVDPPHGQTGAAPNNLELHPILDIHFASTLPPTANFSTSVSTACVGQSIYLTDNSTNVPTSWSWTMTGGTPASSTSQNPSVSYTTNGTYTVSLVSTNSNGSSSSFSKTITVNNCSGNPVANFTPSATTVCVGQVINLTDNSTNAPTSWNWTMTGGSPTSSTSPNPTVAYNAAGVYTIDLVVTNLAGSSPTFSKIITVNSNPVIPTITSSGSALTSSSSTGNQWYLNGTIINGATGQTYTPTASGAYSVVVTNSLGCSSTSIATNFTVTGIGIIENNELITVYPNPNNGNFMLNYTTTKTEKLNLNLYDLLGHLVYSDEQKTNAGLNQIEIEIPSLAEGIYFLGITTEKGKYTQKLIIQ